MATQRGEEPERGAKRQGASLRKERRAQPKTASTRGGIKERLLLRKDEWHEEKVNILENSERPKQPD